MNINISREAVVDNPLKNNLRPLPHIDSEPVVVIAHKTTVLVLDGPVMFRHKTLDIPYWVVRVLEGDYRDRVGWMAEINQSGKDTLRGI